jgi:hypothetical protein
MAGKIAGTVITIFILTVLVALIIFYFTQMSIKEEVNDINYSTAENISTTGKFTGSLFVFLRDSLSRYQADCIITVKLEKRPDPVNSPDLYETFFENSSTLNAYVKDNSSGSSILDKPLNVGDRVTIYIESQSPTLFGKLINAVFLGHAPTQMIDTNIKSLKSGIISKKGS